MSPVIAFRGTANMAGVLDDANLEGVGTYQFAIDEVKVANMMASLSARGQVACVGHSLGGALAQISASKYPGVTGEIVTFQSPGVGGDTAKKVDDFNAKHEDDIESTHYRVSGDLVP